MFIAAKRTPEPVEIRDTLTIEVPRPNTVDELQTIRREASDRAYVEAVLDLVRRGIISAGYEAGLLKIDAATLLELLQRHGISVADYPADTLRQEIEEALHDFAPDADRQGGIDHLALQFAKHWSVFLRPPCEG